MLSKGQLWLLAAAIGVLVVGAFVSLCRIARPSEKLRIAAKACHYTGLSLAMVVLIWHSAVRGRWLPLEDNFDALVWLAMLLTVFVLYVQRSKPLAGLDWFVIPISILMLTGAAIFGYSEPRAYAMGSVWSWVHRVAACAGAVFFAIAGATGAMYLVAHHRLRARTAVKGTQLGSLERVEHLTYSAITLGFGLLSLSLAIGVVEVMARHQDARWLTKPKVVLAMAAWLVYAATLHTPMNPSFRGRRTALLSLVGLVLVIGAIVTVEVAGGAL